MKKIRLILFTLCVFCFHSVIAAMVNIDVLVYSATPAGIASAISAAKSGCSVLLIEPTKQIGGLMTSGLSHPDFRTFEGLSGLYWEFARNVENYYAKTYGRNSTQVRDCFRGVSAEPRVNLLVFEQMLDKYPKIKIRREFALKFVNTTMAQNHKRITSVVFTDPKGKIVTVKAKIFIDASYEGDLMAMSGTPWRAGRESKNRYNESLAQDNADDQLQGYNFRFIMTNVETNRVMPQPPPGYRREDFIDILPILESGKIKSVFTYGFSTDGIFKAQIPRLPNGKYDINDVSHGVVRLSLPGLNKGWIGGDPQARKKIFNEHLYYQLGLLYFLQNDTAVSEKLRRDAREWGFCKDEFDNYNHLPPQLYVREARRMIGMYIYTQQDSEQAEDDARAVLHRDSIAVGDYGHNCHGTGHDGPRIGGKHTGEFYNQTPPYQIPYGVIVPFEVENLLVPVAVSASHVGFCAIRYEYIWMSLGQAAGHVAALATRRNITVQKIDVFELQKRLHRDRLATIYLSDVPPDSPDFIIAQWWGTIGGFHGLAPAPAKPGICGALITGQYYEAFPNHSADLEKILDKSLAERWRKLAEEAGIPVNKLPLADGKTTRKMFIYKAAKMAGIK
ncbi:MAG: FAD-dependent oxidoreductase [Verrucomicrobiae bacterium]|nr:FAD-dependent oxidoreductase [Verrucomicrobiae bacterium]